MRYLIIYILLVSIVCKAQYKDEDIALFNKGIALYELKNEGFDLYIDYDSISNQTFNLEVVNEQTKKLEKTVLKKSHEYFSELIEKHPKSKLFFYALNNKAQIEYELGQLDSAKKTYVQILNSKANDKEKYYGGGLMGESYTNYKNRACIRLADIEYNEGNYDEAIKYLELTKKYPYQHFCGNAYASMDISMAMQYAKNYEALGDTKKALDYLLPHIFPNGLAKNENLVHYTADILKKKYGIENIKTMFAAAKKSLVFKDSKKNDGYYTITFLEREIIIDMPIYLFMESANDEISEISKAMEDSLISKLLK